MVSDPIRHCGPCSACCTVLGVPELGKGTFEPCRHLGEGGCAIYDDRPESCRRFECEWLRGLLEVDGTIDPDLRPDSCGVILEYRPGTPFGDVYRAWEVRPGAAGHGTARDIIDGLAERFLVVVVAAAPRDEEGPGDRGSPGALPRLVGPPQLVMQASDVMWSFWELG